MPGPLHTWVLSECDFAILTRTTLLPQSDRQMKTSVNLLPKEQHRRHELLNECSSGKLMRDETPTDWEDEQKVVSRTTGEERQSGNLEIWSQVECVYCLVTALSDTALTMQLKRILYYCGKDSDSAPRNINNNNNKMYICIMASVLHVT